MAFPRARALPPRLNVTLLIVAAACEPREHVNGPGSSWYERTRLLDATADGKLDTLRLRASGPRGDSLNVTFTVVSSGREVVREEWGSDYMLVDPPFERPTPQAVVDSFIRAQLDTTLGRAAMHPVADIQFRERWPPVQ